MKLNSLTMTINGHVFRVAQTDEGRVLIDTDHRDGIKVQFLDLGPATVKAIVMAASQFKAVRAGNAA